jgi:exodeoxyribonuclease VII small subunit
MVGTNVGETPSFTAARARVRECIRLLSKNDIDLDEAVERFEEACVLIGSLEARIKHARLRVSDIAGRHLQDCDCADTAA